MKELLKPSIFKLNKTVKIWRVKFFDTITVLGDGVKTGYRGCCIRNKLYEVCMQAEKFCGPWIVEDNFK